MNIRVWMALAGLAVMTGTAQGQSAQRRATLTGGNSDRGKCTIEVVVDGAAEVEVRGDSAVLRNVWGQPPQWRRFQCSGVIPANPADFRFTGVDGRGKMDLISDPRNGGVAVVRIEDPKAGTEGYTFDLTWSGGASGSGPMAPGQARGPRDDNRWNAAPGDRDHDRARRFAPDDAVRACQDAVSQQVGARWESGDIAFRRTAIDDNPGRRDSIVGAFDVRARDGRQATYRFSCSVDFDNGRVESAQIEGLQGDGRDRGDDRRGPGSNADVLQVCQRAVEDRLRRDGYARIDFRSLRADDRPRRNDSVVGSVRAERRDGSDSFDFACSMDFRSGEIRSVDVMRR